MIKIPDGGTETSATDSHEVLRSTTATELSPPTPDASMALFRLLSAASGFVADEAARPHGAFALAHVENLTSPGMSGVLRWWCEQQGHAGEPLCVGQFGGVGAILAGWAIWAGWARHPVTEGVALP